MSNSITRHDSVVGVGLAWGKVRAQVKHPGANGGDWYDVPVRIVEDRVRILRPPQEPFYARITYEAAAELKGHDA